MYRLGNKPPKLRMTGRPQQQPPTGRSAAISSVWFLADESWHLTPNVPKLHNWLCRTRHIENELTRFIFVFDNRRVATWRNVLQIELALFAYRRLELLSIRSDS